MIFVILSLIIIVVGATAIGFDVSIGVALLILLGLLISAGLLFVLANYIVSKTKSKEAGKRIVTMLRIGAIILALVGLCMSLYGCMGDFGYDVVIGTDKYGNETIVAKDKISPLAYLGIFLIVAGGVLFLSLGAAIAQPDENSSPQNSFPKKNNTSFSLNMLLNTFKIEYMAFVITLCLEKDYLTYEKRLKANNQKIMGVSIPYSELSRVVVEDSEALGTIKLYFGARSLTVNFTKPNAIANAFVTALEKNLRSLNLTVEIERI